MEKEQKALLKANFSFEEPAAPAPVAEEENKKSSKKKQEPVVEITEEPIAEKVEDENREDSN
jgi:hypothetical protein